MYHSQIIIEGVEKLVCLAREDLRFGDAGTKCRKYLVGTQFASQHDRGKELVDYFQCHDATQIEEREAYFAYEWVYFACFRNESLFFHGNPLRCP